MINLITGVPGAGKTCYALSFMQQQTKEGRQLFVHGIPQLKIPHIDVYCSSPNCDVCTTFTEEDKQKMHPAETWHEWAPDGAVLFYDEVQNVYRPRSSASKAPASIQAFEVHRHRGLDFYLISQSPKLFDSNIRQLISRHIHLRSSWSGRYQFEWSECKDNTQSTSDAVKSSYKLNPKMFDLYHSASLHTKQKRKLPVAVFILGLAVIGFIALGSRIYFRLSELNSPQVATEQGGDSRESTLLASANRSEPRQNDLPVSNYQDPRFDFIPTVKGVLESAPAYSNVVIVKTFPKIQACIASTEKCTCYTQQMTVYPTTLEQCLDNINGGTTAFNPFKDEQPQVQKTTINQDT